ncbi:MAG TPA: glycine C-acetyltransferase [bacterium]|nr:glycine C-acetyltransferase [bacterium]
MAYSDTARSLLNGILSEIRDAGLYKEERIIHSAQHPRMNVEFPAGSDTTPVLNMCANNYLGLSNHPDVIAAARAALDTHGFGMSSVRFICGTQDLHVQLEDKLTDFLGTEGTILFPSCLDANAGVFEAFTTEEDVLIADRLVHASIIDGIRLSKAQQDTYKHSNLEHLEQKLELHQDKRLRVIVTDGVFSMDGDLAKLDGIVSLAEKHDALVFVDDAHATGFIGERGRGTPEHFGVMGKIDILTTTLGKAMGGATGGCVSGRKEIVDLCRQRARPYLFSNAVAPPITAAGLKVLEMLSGSTALRDKLERNAAWWRSELVGAGFDVKQGESPIVPVMLYEAKLAQDFARDLYAEGVFAVGFFFPVVAKGQARIRTQLSAAHEMEDLERALAAFKKVGEKYGILGLGKKDILAKYGAGV